MLLLLQVIDNPKSVEMQSSRQAAPKAKVLLLVPVIIALNIEGSVELPMLETTTWHDSSKDTCSAGRLLHFANPSVKAAGALLL